MGYSTFCSQDISRHLIVKSSWWSVLRCPSIVRGPSTPRYSPSLSTSLSRPNTRCFLLVTGQLPFLFSIKSFIPNLLQKSGAFFCFWTIKVHSICSQYESPNPVIDTSDVQHLTWPHRKYIQVCVQNVSDVNFTLAELKLTEKQHASLELQSLNTKKQQVRRRQLNTSVTTGWISSLLPLFETTVHSFFTVHLWC